MTRTATSDGAVMGTAGYMSPEQARGQAVDKRTDIWAFGCVLYEMLTGQVAFKGDTIVGHHRRRPRARAGLECAAGRDAGQRSRAAATLPRKGSEAPFTGFR